MSTSDPVLAFGVAPLARPVHRLRPWIIGLIYILALLLFMSRFRQSANVISRYMTIEAIVERGTLALEKTPMWKRARPADLVKFGSHFYSDKPPVLSALASPIYLLLVLFDVRFCVSEFNFAISNLVLTWSVVGLSSGLTLVWLRRILQTVPIAPFAADLLTLSFGFGSLLFSYAVTFNNHSVAASLITGSMAATLLEPAGSRAGLSRFFAGLLAALAATIDLPAGGLVLAGLGLYQAIRLRSLPWHYILGSVGPLLLHAVLQSMVTGTPLPAEMYPDAFNFPGSFWLDPANVWHEHGPRWRFGLELLVGPRGWLTVTPVLAFGLVGLALVLSSPGDPLRPMAWVVAGSIFMLICYYTWVVRRTDFGGESFGTRHLLAISPACFVFAVVGLQRLWRWWVIPVIFAAAIGIGGVYAVIGMNDPWKPIEELRKTDPWLKAVQHLVIYPRSQNLERTEGPR